MDGSRLARALWGGGYAPENDAIAYGRNVDRQAARSELVDALAGTWPAQMAKSAVGAAALPGDVYAGRVDPMSQQGIERAADLAGFTTLGSFAAPRPAGSIGMGGMPDKPGIRAYHGTPHDFDKFDLSKIGTGEGNQVYGHGLYFAEAEDVAKAYKGVQGMASANPMPNVASKHLQSYGDTPEARDMTRLIFPKATDAEIEAAINVAKNPPPGSMYEVNIKANPDDFLDWDKPISEQGARVQAVYEKYKSSKIGQIADKSNRGDISAGSGQWGQPTGKELHDLLNEGLINYGKPRPYLDVRRETTERLNKSGIPGIKYLDQGSRAAGDGSRNYVVFDDKLIEILRKYGLTGLLGLGAVGGAYQSQTNEGGT